MKDLLAATADPGPAFTPRPLHMRIDGPADLRWLAFGKRDDSRFLIVWRDINVWNPSTKSDIAVAPASVTVSARHDPHVRDRRQDPHHPDGQERLTHPLRCRPVRGCADWAGAD